MEGILTLERRRERLAAAHSALQGLEAELWRAGGDDLGPLLGELDALAGACDAGKVAVISEAEARGETTGGLHATTTVGWVRHWAPSTRSGGAGQLVTVAQAFAKAANAPVREAVDSGRLPVRSAAVVVAEADRLRPLLAEGAEPHVLEGLIGMAVQHGPRGCRMVRPALLARYGLEDVLQREQSATKRFVALSQPHDDGSGVFEYRLALDVEGKAVLEAALGPLSAPNPSKGGPDLRPSDQRRGDALVTLVRRAVMASESVPTAPKAQLFLTLDWDQLRDRRSDDHRGSRRRHTLGPRHGPADRLRRCRHPHRPRRRRRGPRLGPRTSPVHPRPDEAALAARRRLHFPRLLGPSAVVRRAPPRALG